MRHFPKPPRVFWSLALLAAALLTIFILPILAVNLQRHLISGLFTIMYISAALSLEKRKSWIIGYSLIVLFLEWFSGVFDLTILSAASKAANVIFFFIIVIMLIRQIFGARQVTAMVILESIIGYLLIGIIYTLFIMFIMQIDPSAFSYTVNHASAGGLTSHFSDSVYFTFVTIATLGYGDIVPLQPYTRSLSILISISGQFYIAILVALLVGKFAARSDFSEE
jgi:voltage-gated potassium channel